MSTATVAWLTDDERAVAFPRMGAREPVSSASPRDPSWQSQNEPDDFTRIETPPSFRRAFTPQSVGTLMSEQQFSDYGLRVFTHEAASWLVPADADTLVGDHPSDAWLPATVERVAGLERLASEEGAPFSALSASDALLFAREVNASQRPSVFLIDNGNLRLLWTSGDEQIGLQFRAEGIIQFVMFARRGNRLATHMGDDDQAGVMRQITASGLRHLLGSR